MSCRRSFSSARNSPCFGQKKRKLNRQVRKLLYSGVSQRRAARLLAINRKTVVRKLLFGAQCAVQRNLAFRAHGRTEGKGLIQALQFDEMETFERSKCLPVSLLLAVEESSRKILGFRVCSMPANGLLAAISRKKYGRRVDHRPLAAMSLFAEISPLIAQDAKITTDQNPKYPAWLKPHFPQAKHVAHRGRRGCVVGQGELKKIGFDPLFDLNHTAAMLRANINRLFRRTWCTTKRMDRLAAHIAIYVDFHNHELTPAL